jgi:hypothetical protein
MIDKSLTKIEEQQRAVCEGYGRPCTQLGWNPNWDLLYKQKGKVPINGLRHPPQFDTNGWYIWCREELPSASDFCFLPGDT